MRRPPPRAFAVGREWQRVRTQTCASCHRDTPQAGAFLVSGFLLKYIGFCHRPVLDLQKNGRSPRVPVLCTQFPIIRLLISVFIMINEKMSKTIVNENP